MEHNLLSSSLYSSFLDDDEEVRLGDFGQEEKRQLSDGEEAEQGYDRDRDNGRERFAD